MSADNFNTVIQGADGKWYAGRNFSMSHWLDMAQATGYWKALEQVRDGEHEVFGTADEAAASMEDSDTEYGTSVIVYEEWFDKFKDA